MYYKIEISGSESAVACPACGSAVRVIKQPARLYGECSCGAKMEFTQRKAVRIPKNIMFVCSGCQDWGSAPETLAGTNVSCKKCGNRVKVPYPRQ